MTGGRYFPAEDAEGLADAIGDVIQGMDRFVYVALGDSYQAGEGAGNSIVGTEEYLERAYESGANYPLSVGPQQDTYSDALGGDGCHRALANYAKLNRDLLEPGAEVVLVDLTCSGAGIEPGLKPPIVGEVGATEADPSSQLVDAVERLQAVGLAPSDVDLVTVGMGGNDAKFGDVVAACFIPNLVQELCAPTPILRGRSSTSPGWSPAGCSTWPSSRWATPSTPSLPR